MSVATDILLNINATTSGTADVNAITKGINQLTAETAALNGRVNATKPQLEEMRDKLLAAARGFAVGSQEAIALARAAGQVQQQLNLVTRAEEQATAAARRHAEEMRRAAEAAARQAQQQAQANSITARAGQAAQDAAAGMQTLKTALYAVIGSEIVQGLRSIWMEMRKLADEANQAQTDVKVFELTMRTFNVSIDSASAVAERLADRFGTSVESVKGSMTTLVRAGFRDMTQLERVMTGAGASMIAKTGQLGNAFDLLGDAAVTGLSAALNSMGISENLGPAMDRYAKSVGKTADELGELERAQVVANLVLKATGTEVGALDTILNDYTRAQAESKREMTELRKEAGEMFKPIVQALTAEMTIGIREARAWGKANKEDLANGLRAAAIAAVDFGGAVKVLLGFIGDVAVGTGGLVTILLGLPVAIAGGVVGAVRAAVNEMHVIFQTGVEGMAALQKAWNQLKSGDVKGALATVGDAKQKVVNALRDAPTNIWEGYAQGSAFGQGMMLEGGADLATFGSRTTGATASADAGSTRVRNAVDGLVKGNEVIEALGMVGRTQGAAFGSKYSFTQKDGKTYTGTHNGVDFFAPRGTAVTAPVTGMLSLHEDEKNGKYFEIVDALGNRIKGLHLDAFEKGLQEAVKAAGGKLLVEQGTKIGGVGDTGNLSEGNHLHLMVVSALGKILNPLTTGLKNVTEGRPWMGTSNPAPVTAPAGDDGDAAKKRAALLASIDASVAAGRVSAAQRTLADLKRIQQDELAAAGENAQKRAAIIQASSGKIVAAEQRIAQAVREQAVKAAGQWAKDQLDKEGADAKAIETERVRRVREAYAVEAQARATAVSEQNRVVNGAQEAAAKEQERIQREANRKAAQLAEQARQGKIQDARLSLTELTSARDQELKLVEGNAAKRLEVERRYAETIRKAKKAIADAEYADAKRDAENRGDRNTANDIARAGRVRDQAYAEADRDATNRVNTAIKSERDAVRSLREEYSRLADGVREKVAAGTFDTAAQQEALKAFNALGAKAKEAGLYTNEHAVAARRSAFALIDQGVATADLIRQSSERIQQIKDENALLDAEAEDARTTIPHLTGMLAELVAQGLDPRKSGFVQLLEEIISKGGQAGDAAKYVLDNLTQLEADLGGDSPAAIQFRGKRALDNARAALDPELPSEGTTTLEESTANQITGQVLDRIFRQPQTLGGRLIAATGAILTDAFNDMGEAGREAFWEEFAALVDDPEVGDIGPQLARVLLRRLTDAPEFDALREKLTGILDAESAGNLGRAQGAVTEANTLAESDPDGALGILEDTLTDLYAAAERGEDAADGINLVTDAINRLTEAREKGEKAALDDLLSTGNTDAAAGAVKAADALAGDGQYADALEVLESTLTDLYAAAEEGEDAADAINTVIDAINRLTKARDDAQDKTQAKRALEVADAQDKVADSSRALAAAMGQQERPHADQIRALEKLKKDFPELGEEIDALIVKWRALQAQDEKLNKFSTYAQYVQQLAGAFGQLGEAMNNPNLSGAANLAGKLASGFQAVMAGFKSGGILGAAVAGGTALLSLVADAVSGFQRAKQAAEDARKSFQSAFKLIDSSTFSTFGTRSRGFFADLFGGGPEVIQQVNEVAASIARTLESGVSGAFQNGIKRFLNGEGSVLDGLRSGIRDTVVNAITEAVIQGTVIKGALGGLLTDLTNTLAGGGDASGIISQIGATLPTVAAALEATLSPLIGTLNAALGSNTQAVNANTKALNEAQFQNTTVVSFGQSGQSGRLSRRLAGAL